MVYLSESGQGGWGEVVLPSPSSEPPPPYSPPRVSHHHHFFPQGFPHHHIYHAITEYYDLTSSQPSSLTSHDTASIKDPPPPYPPTTTLKTAHAALNHGPSSAFSPPTKTIKYSYPPPYTPADSNSSGRVKIPQPQVQQQQDPVAPGNRGLASDPRHRSRRLHPPRHQQNISSLDERYRINEDDSRSSGGSRRVPAATTDRHGVYPASSRSVMGSGHPRGPLLRTGKSLELPHERLTQHHPPPTAHTHPRHLHHSHHRTKDTSGHHRTKEPFGTNTQSKSNQLAYVGILPCKPSRVRDKVVPPVDLRGSNRCEEQWMTRASRLEAAAARTMMAARAVPVTAVNNHAHSLEYENNMMRGRLRSCRSLDELSDLLDEEASIPRHHPVVTRSLDDLTEPLYENFDIINAHARRTHERTKHNTSVPDLLEPPPRPPRQRNSSLSSLLEVSNSSAASLSRRALNTSVPDVLEGGGLSWGSPTSTLRSTASTSAATFDRDAMSDISVQLQKIREVARVLGVKYRRGELSSSSASSSGAGSTHTSPRMPPHALTPPPHVPGVPARAPVIHDVLKEGKKLSPPQQVHPRTTTLTRDTDATSQESGYGSVDSRSHRLQQFYFHHPQSHVGKQQQHLREHPHLSKAQQQLSNSSQLASTQYQLEKNESSPGSSQLQRNCPRLAQVTSQSQRQQSFQSRDSLQNPQQSSTFPTQYSQHQLDNLQQHAQHHQQKLHQKHQQRNHHLQWHQAAKQKQPIQQLELHQGVNQDKLGIYIKSVVPGGAADQDGRLQAGDQLLSVDGKSLIGITQERAAEYMMETGPVVTLEVARQGAIYHGLATILSQPSPHVNRASLRKMRPRAEEAPRAAMTNSQSTPNMGGYNERLVDWNQPPRQHPLPPTSSHSSVMARSSPNLAAPVEGTDVNHLASAPTNKPAYAQSKLSPLRTSLPNLGPSILPLYPPPLISVIPSERVEVGIEHRTMDHTRSNPNLPKYTFTPPSETSSTSCNVSTSSSSSTSSSWRQHQRDVGHGAGCAAIRRGSGPPSLIADGGIDLSCHMHDDAKPWRSLVDVSVKGNVDNTLDDYCERTPTTTSPMNTEHPIIPQLVSRVSCPLLPSRPAVCPSSEIYSIRRRPNLRHQMSIAPSIAQSSPSLLLVHSPPSTPPPSQANSLQLQQTSSAAPIGN
ncbi:hypothetical protein OTU49_004954 [Cherax quadricarinatus]|uniref:PDZ domain-containing protein n=2 Tax=Cherax quadricarinatus TaxID=27406 RepID=A0AAW0X9U8_CHEQU